MYFPILRGRQFELLALRECITNKILSEHIIPILEPVKVSSTYTKTIETFINANKKIAIINNPQVGTWGKDLNKEGNIKIKEQITQQLVNENLLSALYVTSDLSAQINLLNSNGTTIDNLLLICNNPEYLDCYEKVVGTNKPLYNIIPDKSDFRRRIRHNRVMCDDHFPKQSRNIDYANIDTEFFSSDHLYYSDDGYKGFSDYSVVGKEYNETGFAPYAVAIHIVYFDEKDNLRIAHFVSDSNDDISDPARKFSEAVKKLVEWNATMKINTFAMREFKVAYENQNYPGLGVIKKYSIMHHLELISQYLDKVQK